MATVRSTEKSFGGYKAEYDHSDDNDEQQYADKT